MILYFVTTVHVRIVETCWLNATEKCGIAAIIIDIMCHQHNVSPDHSANHCYAYVVYFPSNIFVNRIGRTPNTTRPFLYSCPYAHTNYYQYSFVPRTVSAWNALPLPVVAAELCSFKSNVWVHI